MKLRATLSLIGVLVIVLGLVVVTAAPAAAGDSPAKRAAKGELKASVIKVPGTTPGTTINRTLPTLSGAFVAAAKAAMQPDDRADQADQGPSGDVSVDPIGATKQTLGCSSRNSAEKNVRVNQDCTFRRQAEEEIAYNPADPKNLVGGQNDSRVGFNQCGIDFSTDNGQHWGDMLPPFRQKLNNPAAEEPTPSDPNRHTILGGPGTIHTYDAASDPAPAFDSQGRAFFSCVVFDVNSGAQGIFVTESPRGAQGSFFYNLSSFSRSFMAVEDNTFALVHDKELIAADRYPSSPNRDNVYLTWTIFRIDQNGNATQSPIYGSMSTDHAVHWSTPELISGSSDTLCFFGNALDPTAPPHACNFDQGSDPSVLPNGDLSVIFNNGNTPAGNPNAQQLAVLCHPSGSSPAGTAHLNCGSPSKVGDDIIAGEPQCDFGRGPEECVPGPFIRTNDFPRISLNTQDNHLFATWQDYRNQEYDIQLAESTDGGATWKEVGTVNPDRGLDHYMPAVERALVDGDTLGDSYYRSERVPNENVPPAGAHGFQPGMPGVQKAMSDYTLAGSEGPTVPFAFKVLTPEFPAPDGIQAGFNGDYSGLTINQGTQAHPIWSDTRNSDPFAPTNGVKHDEDIFTDAVSLPSGHGEDRG